MLTGSKPRPSMTLKALSCDKTESVALDNGADGQYVLAMQKILAPHATNPGDGRWTVAEAVKRCRTLSDEPLRVVAERAGVSVAQINRIENGHVHHPTAEMLIAIARGLQRNPLFLLILSGHIAEAEARRRLIDLLAEGTEVAAEWRGEAEKEGALLADPAHPVDEVHHVAFDLFVGEELVETSWSEWSLLLATGSESEETREVAALLESISPERWERVLTYLRDQVELSRRDMLRDELTYRNDAPDVEGEEDPSEGRDHDGV